MQDRIKRIGAVIAGAALLAHWALAQEPTPRSLGLMKSVIIPASDAVFAAGKSAPKTDREWSAVENGATKLVEAGKTLAGEAPANGGPAWTKLAHAMADAAAVAGKAAKEKNVDAVLDAGDVLYTTCEDCHRQYMKK